MLHWWHRISFKREQASQPFKNVRAYLPHWQDKEKLLWFILWNSSLSSHDQIDRTARQNVIPILNYILCCSWIFSVNLWTVFCWCSWILKTHPQAFGVWTPWLLMTWFAAHVAPACPHRQWACIHSMASLMTIQTFDGGVAAPVAHPTLVPRVSVARNDRPFVEIS